MNLAFNGWQPGKVITVAARSSMGKTSFVMPMLYRGGVLRDSRRAEFLVLSWEMQDTDYIKRLVALDSGIDNKMMMQGAKLLSAEQEQVITSSFSSMADLPIQYQIASTNQKVVSSLVYDFIEECENKSKNQGIQIQPIVVIDHIGLAQFEKTGLRTYQIGEFIFTMKQIANHTGCSFIILNQINRSSDQTKDIPNVADISDSQSVEQTSDAMIILHRPEHYRIDTLTDPRTGDEIDSRGKTIVRIGKNRMGNVGDVIVNSDMRLARYWYPSHEWSYDYNELYKKEDFWRKIFKLY